MKSVFEETAEEIQCNVRQKNNDPKGSTAAESIWHEKWCLFFFQPKQFPKQGFFLTVNCYLFYRQILKKEKNKKIKDKIDIKDNNCKYDETNRMSWLRWFAWTNRLVHLEMG